MYTFYFFLPGGEDSTQIYISTIGQNFGGSRGGGHFLYFEDSLAKFTYFYPGISLEIFVFSNKIKPLLYKVSILFASSTLLANGPVSKSRLKS